MEIRVSLRCAIAKLIAFEFRNADGREAKRRLPNKPLDYLEGDERGVETLGCPGRDEL